MLRSCVFCLAILVAMLTQVSVSESANACTLTSHCYALVFNNAQQETGVQVNINPYCLTTTSGDFVTDETWLTTASITNYWVEAGYLEKGANVNVGGITAAGRYGFYADSRPGGGFHAHVLVTNPTLDDHIVQIYDDGSNRFSAGFGTYFGDSTNNSMNPWLGQYGSETTTGASHSYAFFSKMMYRNSNYVWQSGVVNPGYRNDSPQTSTWFNPPYSFNGGVPCPTS